MSRKGVIEPQQTGLKLRIERFCIAYVGNGGRSKRAAMEAGYGDANAGTQASEFLRMPDVQRRISVLKREYFQRLQMDKHELLGRVATMARSDPERCFDDDGKLLALKLIPPEIRACITEYDPKKGTVKLEPRAPAMQMLGKYHRVLGETLEVTGKDGKDLVPQADDIEVAKRIAFLLTSAQNKATA